MRMCSLGFSQLHTAADGFRGDASFPFLLFQGRDICRGVLVGQEEQYKALLRPTVWYCPELTVCHCFPAAWDTCAQTRRWARDPSDRH